MRTLIQEEISLVHGGKNFSDGFAMSGMGALAMLPVGALAGYIKFFYLTGRMDAIVVARIMKTNPYYITLLAGMGVGSLVGAVGGALYYLVSSEEAAPTPEPPVVVKPKHGK